MHSITNSGNARRKNEKRATIFIDENGSYDGTNDEDTAAENDGFNNNHARFFSEHLNVDGYGPPYANEQ